MTSPRPTASGASHTPTTAAAFAHGLVVQALFAPDAFPPERQTRLLDAFLTGLGGSVSANT